jgi:hypothetical protein
MTWFSISLLSTPNQATGPAIILADCSRVWVNGRDHIDAFPNSPFGTSSRWYPGSITPSDERVVASRLRPETTLPRLNQKRIECVGECYESSALVVVSGHTTLIEPAPMKSLG